MATAPPLDSKEGMQILFDWARATGAVLNEWHERTAQKYGITTTGVKISRPIPFRKSLT